MKRALVVFLLFFSFSCRGDELAQADLDLILPTVKAYFNAMHDDDWGIALGISAEVTRNNIGSFAKFKEVIETNFPQFKEVQQISFIASKALPDHKGMYGFCMLTGRKNYDVILSVVFENEHWRIIQPVYFKPSTRKFI